METHLLAIQAKILLWTGLGWLVIGLYLGQDPTTVAWRAALGAFAAMWCVGKLLHQVAGVIEEAAAAHATEQQLAAEKAAEKPPGKGLGGGQSGTSGAAGARR
jgi:hypothetical protein